MELSLSSLITGLVSAVVVWTWRDLKNRVEKINDAIMETHKDLQKHKVDSATNYVSYDECKDRRDEYRGGDIPEDLFQDAFVR